MGKLVVVLGKGFWWGRKRAGVWVRLSEVRAVAVFIFSGRRSEE
jgi:hypothetical protein